MDYAKECGKRLKAARQAKGLTLVGLSKALRGVLSASRIGNYEQGTRQLGTEEALALAVPLDVEPAYLLCVEAGDEMTKQENELLRDFRALPENERSAYARRISVLAMAYREPVPDEKLSPAWSAKGKARRETPDKHS